jgi:inorganic pyrophosphatase
MRNIIWISIPLLLVFACNNSVPEAHTPADPYTIDSPLHLLNGFEPVDETGTIQVVVEIPTGTLEKWEVEKTSGDLKLEIIDGLPRIVQYLGYPGNYGMIPKTLLPKELGGDGDPLDVIVLGPAAGKGQLIKARLIGVLELLDSGEQDDKLLAVAADSPFREVDSLKELDSLFAGTSEIVRIWFENYKGPGVMEVIDFGDEQRAQEILEMAIEQYAIRAN